ncbi:glycosyltransferase family 4 protein [Caulobacter henricii]|uniref:glycosyltransferase family 4 protein n=1 Tax=Caulobacter henricii TaxID=69395 RepID=UPI0009FD5B00|nr:glycosyltransferase family 4 protein [Caulobacter henricii]
MKKVAVFSAHFPPHIVGGAEYSACQLARGLSARGYDVSVLSTAPDVAMRGTFVDEVGGFDVFRVLMPRPYQAFNFAGQKTLDKIIWHTQDLVDPRNVKIWKDFISDNNPDVAFVHVPQGLGFNGLDALARANIPTIIVLHDLSLLCVKTSMFRDGHDCQKLCGECKFGSLFKIAALKRIKQLHIVSPSQANLDQFLRISGIVPASASVIINPNEYPRPTVAQVNRARIKLRLLYVGQISAIKGVDFLIGAILSAKLIDRVELRVVGSGRDLEQLRLKYAKQTAISFSGHVSQQEVANAMASADILCVPSLWRENSPGVVIQALQIGLPVFASRTGGIPELVRDGIDGKLLRPGDENDWSESISSIIKDPGVLDLYRRKIRDSSDRFSASQSVNSYIDLIEKL